jgi:acetyl-CoA C-acetyltransferase
MAQLDPRTPVIVGTGQLTWRDDDAPSPLELMTQVARHAADDAGAAGLLQRLDSVAVVDIVSWPVPDPAAALAAELGATPRETVRSERGGTGPAELLGDLSQRIQDGEFDIALIAGGEAFRPFKRATQAGESLGWPTQPDGAAPTRSVGIDRPPSHAVELGAGLIAPIFWYPLFETAVRKAAGRDPVAHEIWLGHLWARFAAVAAENEYAWTREPLGAETITTISLANRAVSYPYPKLMNSNIEVDQAAALLLCSAQAAQDAGVPRDRWVFVHAVGGGHDHWFPGERDALHRSPALRASGRAALGHAGVGIDDVGRLDLYSCFPSAVQVAATELGIDLETDERAPTVTGGLGFAGGPANDYVTHSLATLAARLREDGGDARGLATGVGWYLTKHAVTVLGAAPPERPFARLDVQAEVDGLPSREIVGSVSGPAPVEAYTALYDRDGTPTLGIVSCVLEDGRRTFARTDDAGTLASLLDGSEAIGRTAALDAAGGFAL